MAESENIVAETAEKIFADLADAQTINRDKNGAWKAPLWQALTEVRPAAVMGAGGLRRLGREPRRRLFRSRRRRTFRRRRAAGRNHARRLAAGAGQNLLARRRDDGGARKPEGPHHAQCRWQPVRQGPRRAVRESRKTYRGHRRRCEGTFDRAGRRRQMPDRGRPRPRRRPQRYRDLRQGAAGHDQAGAEGF